MLLPLVASFVAGMHSKNLYNYISTWDAHLIGRDSVDEFFPILTQLRIMKFQI